MSFAAKMRRRIDRLVDDQPGYGPWKLVTHSRDSISGTVAFCTVWPSLLSATNVGFQLFTGHFTPSGVASGMGGVPCKAATKNRSCRSGARRALPPGPGI